MKGLINVSHFLFASAAYESYLLGRKSKPDTMKKNGILNAPNHAPKNGTELSPQ